MRLFVVLAIAIALLAVIFALQNTMVVGVSFLPWQFEGPLALFLLITLALGIGVGLLVSIPAIVRRSWSLSRQTHQVESLNQQLQDKDQERDRQLAAARQDRQAQQTAHQNLLQALAIADPHTGLLKQDWLPQGVQYWLSHAGAVDNTLPALCLYLLEEHAVAANPTDQRLLQEAIAQRLQEAVPSTGWLFTDSKGGFAVLIPGLDVKTAQALGDRLRDALTKTPVTVAGISTTIEAAIGGIIAHPTRGINADQLLQQGQAALDHAKQRGRNRVRLVEAQRD
jgi:GGDEF domain-containing protein/uncharacterized integral membrane protein